VNHNVRKNNVRNLPTSGKTQGIAQETKEAGKWGIARFNA
jgi:hypothetical protein